MKFMRIIKSKEKRMESKNIVLVTLPSMIKKGSFIDPNLLLGSTNFTNESIERYFLTELNNRQLPYHYACEQVKGDFPIFIGENQFTPSSYLSELAELNLIPYSMRHSILICLFEDFNIDIPNERMYHMLSSRLLSKLMKEHNVDQSRVHFIDEILNWQAVDIATKSKYLEYPIKKSNFFNRVVLDNILKGYKIT